MRNFGQGCDGDEIFKLGSERVFYFKKRLAMRYRD